jgi:uncharacterized membrane protein
MTIVAPIVARKSPMHRGMTAVLRSITVLSGLVILAGGALWQHCNASAPAVFHLFHGEPASLRSVPQIVMGAFRGDALALIQLGILLLIATPVLRVLFVGIGYAMERDWLYVTVAGIVLAVLAASLTGHRL